MAGRLLLLLSACLLLPGPSLACLAWLPWLPAWLCDWLPSSSQPSQANQTGLIMSYWQDVELWVPESGLQCRLPSPGDIWVRHTMEGTTLCGGGYMSRKCASLRDGAWVESHSLAMGRVWGMSWAAQSGIILIGGANFEKPHTEQLLQDGTTKPLFDLKYVGNENQCAIPEPDNTVVITGISLYRNDRMEQAKVSRYGEAGWLEDLPPLATQRRQHACAGFSRQDGARVLLVAGGRQSATSSQFLTSVELLVVGHSAWRSATPLPVGHKAAAAATIDNTVFITGGLLSEVEEPTDAILEWKDGAQQWSQAGLMLNKMARHAVSTLTVTPDLLKHCN